MQQQSHYESISYTYESSTELSRHLEEMEKQGWSCTSHSYGYLKARFRREIEGNASLNKHD